MDLPTYVNAFLEFTQTYQPMLDATIKFGTSAYAIGASVVKVLQQGKYLTTFAVGKKKPGSKKPARSKSALKRDPIEKKIQNTVQNFRNYTGGPSVLYM